MSKAGKKFLTPAPVVQHKGSRMSTELRPRGRDKEAMTFRFERALLQRARAIARKKKVTITSVVEVCLERHLPELEKA